MAIIIKNSQVATKQPSTDDLQVGQLGVNTADGVLYTKHSDNTIKNLTGVQLSGNQTIAGVKTFSDGVVANVTGNVSGNAGTVTNGVYTTGDQTIAGVKTFSSSPIVPNATQNGQAVNFGQVIGVGQTWQAAELTNTGATFTDGSSKFRAAGVTYTNSTGKPIMVNIISSPSATNYVAITIDGIDLGYNSFTASLGQSSNRNIVPIGATYSVIVEGASLYKWYELR